MRIDKFLEEISQDERVDEITHDKKMGYKLILKEGYGVLNTSYRSQWIEGDYFDYPETCAKCWAREGSQSDIECFLSKVVSYNEQELKLKNKKTKLEALNKMLEKTTKGISRIENEIKYKIELKEKAEKDKNKVLEAIKQLEKEVEDCTGGN